MSEKAIAGTRVVSPLDLPQVKSITRAFLALKKRFSKLTLACIANMGRLLAKARPIVRGQWGRWLRSQLHLGYKSAERYVQVYELSRKDPDFMKRFGSEGANRAYIAARLDPRARAALKTGAANLSNGEVVRLTTPFVRLVSSRGRRSAVSAVASRAADLERRLNSLAGLALVEGELAKVKSALVHLRDTLERILSRMMARHTA